MDPVGSLVGTVLIGLGIVLLYGAVKNKRVFGTAGIVTTALTTGDISDLSIIPQAYEQNPAAAGLDEHQTTAMWQIPLATQAAINNIGRTDPALAAQIDERVRKADADTDKAQLMPLAQLLAIADGKGHQVDTTVIRAYIKGQTGESI